MGAPQPTDVPPVTAPPRAVVVLPAYNEEANIEGLLGGISEALSEAGIAYSIIVVDDGSSDGTARALGACGRDLPLVVCRHEQNQGLGAAIRDGLARAVELAGEDDVVISLDADGSHTPGLMPRMVAMIGEGCDVVIASRYRPGSRVYGLSVARRTLSWCASRLMSALFPIPGVSDYTCSYRAYRAHALREAYRKYGRELVDQEGFQCMVDILLKLRKMSLSFGEAPLILRYDLKQSRSKMRVFRTAWGTLRLLARRRFIG